MEHIHHHRNQSRRRRLWPSLVPPSARRNQCRALPKSDPAARVAQHAARERAIRPARGTRADLVTLLVTLLFSLCTHLTRHLLPAVSPRLSASRLLGSRFSRLAVSWFRSLQRVRSNYPPEWQPRLVRTSRRCSRHGRKFPSPPRSRSRRRWGVDRRGGVGRVGTVNGIGRAYLRWIGATTILR